LSVVFDVVVAVVVLLALGFAPARAHKVRDGWMPTNFVGTHEKRVSRARRNYTVAGWIGLVVSAGYLMAVLEGEPGVYENLLFGVIFLLMAVVAFRCLRILDSPPVGLRRFPEEKKRRDPNGRRSLSLA